MTREDGVSERCSTQSLRVARATSVSPVLANLSGVEYARAPGMRHRGSAAGNARVFARATSAFLDAISQFVYWVRVNVAKRLTR